MQVSCRARSGAHPASGSKAGPRRSQAGRACWGTRDILYVLEHRPLQQDVRRKSRGPATAALHQDVRRKNPRGRASVALHRNDDAPNAAKAAAGSGGVAAGVADDEAAAGAGTVKMLGAPPAGAAGAAGAAAGAGTVGVGTPALGSAPPTARRDSHATSSAGFGGRRSGASPRVFTARTRLAFTNFFS